MFIFFFGCDQDIAKIYHQQLSSTLGEANLDCVVLGLGSDGHVASLFPRQGSDGASVMGDDSRGDKDIIVTSKTAEKEDVPRDRVSMNYGWINAAENIFVIATGNGKRQIVHRLNDNTGADDPLPVQRLNNSKLTFFIDYDAWSE